MINKIEKVYKLPPRHDASMIILYQTKIMVVCSFWSTYVTQLETRPPERAFNESKSQKNKQVINLCLFQSSFTSYNKYK